jgi:hypothetical protein
MLAVVVLVVPTNSLAQMVDMDNLEVKVAVAAGAIMVVHHQLPQQVLRILVVVAVALAETQQQVLMSEKTAAVV